MSNIQSLYNSIMAEVVSYNLWHEFYTALINKVKPQKIVNEPRSPDTDIDLLILEAAPYDEIHDTWYYYLDKLAHRAIIIVKGLNTAPMKKFWDKHAYDKLDTGTILSGQGVGIFYFSKSSFVFDQQAIDLF